MSTEVMSSRERMLAALRGQETDRIAWSPLIVGYYTMGLPEPLRGNNVSTQRAIGADILERDYDVWCQSLDWGIPVLDGRGLFPPTRVTRAGGVELTQQWHGDQLLRVYKTPAGSVRETYEKRESSPWLPFPTEPIVKTLDDLKVLRYIVETIQFQPTFEVFQEMDRQIGEDGLAAASSPTSPFQTLMELQLGVQQFYYFLADHPSEIEETLEVCHIKNLEACRIIADSPAQVVIIYENTSTSYMSPWMFSKYVLPHLNEYSDLYHQAGKIVLIHACGKLKDVAGLLATGRYDGVCDMAPAPTGDLDLVEAKQRWGNSLVAMGGIDCTSFISLSPQAMKTYVLEMLEQVSHYRGVILGSGDAVPLGTPMEALQAVTEAVKEFGHG